MIISLIYFIHIYIYVGVEAYPKVFLNGVYTNKLDKFYVNPHNNILGYRYTEIRQQDAIDIECSKVESREECLRRIKRQPSGYVRGSSKHSSGLEKDYIRESIEDGNTGFSQDYLDINDLLLRTNSDASFEQPFIKQSPRKSQIYKVLKPNKYDRFAFDLTNIRRNNRKKKAYESDEGDSSTSSESRETMRKKKLAKNKRFQIDKSMESGSESSEEIRIKKKKTIKKNKDRLVYMQSPSRLYDFRRRLEHFLPKRYHWNTDDMRELGNYWYSGPTSHT